MWRGRSVYGWRHPLRKGRRKAVRAAYRGLMPRKRRRHRMRVASSSSRRSTSSQDVSPGGCAGCLVAAIGLGLALWVTAAGGSSDLATGLVLGGVVLGIVAGIWVEVQVGRSGSG